MKYRKYIFLCIIMVFLFSCNKKKENNDENIQQDTKESINKTESKTFSGSNEPATEEEKEAMKEFIYTNIEKSIVSIETPLNGNYADGNGSIINSKNDGNTQWIFRKHIQCRKFPVWYNHFNELIIFNEPLIEDATIIGTIKNETLNITQVAEAIVENNYYSWIKISTNSNISGWIFCGKYNDETQRIPYYNNRWEIIEYINIGKESWTIRKLKQTVCVWEKINIHDKPGINNSKIISQIIPTEEKNQIFLDFTEVTEETETINGIKDRWLKINYNNVNGWIFGGKATVERGGPKYFTPEEIIDLEIAYLINGI